MGRSEGGQTWGSSSHCQAGGLGRPLCSSLMPEITLSLHALKVRGHRPSPNLGLSILIFKMGLNP